VKEFWAGFWYGLSGRLALDGLRDLIHMRRQRKACKWLSAQFEARYAHVNSPWGMLDREEARRMAMEYCRRLAIDLNSVQYIRPIYDPRAFL
jgi:hypothetical protein